MKRSSTVFLKGILLLTALAVCIGLLWFPHTEGRATGLDIVSIYTDPLILYIYISSLPFFFGLYQAFTLLSLIEKNKAFSQEAVLTLKYMKLASLSMIGFIGGALIYIRFFVHGDDLAGPSMLGIMLSLAFGVVATAAGVFQKLFQNAVDIKSENDLTV